MLSINNETSSPSEARVMKLPKVAVKSSAKLVKAAPKMAEPCDKRTISQILRESSGGFSFRR
ncbi:hypothetical protein SAMN05443582_109130 [Phyllobacterium sp. OV277]|nr:hypothetical protein SAMN05443582_109130 [Phyllobacterium sp. OV277]